MQEESFETNLWYEKQEKEVVQEILAANRRMFIKLGKGKKKLMRNREAKDII